MTLTRNTVALGLLTLVALIGAIVLLALREPVPEFLSFIIVTGFGAIAGVTVPAHVITTTEPAPRGGALPTPDPS